MQCMHGVFFPTPFAPWLLILVLVILLILSYYLTKTIVLWTAVVTRVYTFTFISVGFQRKTLLGNEMIPVLCSNRPAISICMCLRHLHLSGRQMLVHWNRKYTDNKMHEKEVNSCKIKKKGQLKAPCSRCMSPVPWWNTYSGNLAGDPRGTARWWNNALYFGGGERNG